MSKNKKIVLWTTSLIAFAIVLVLATIFDLRISKSLSLVPAGSYYAQNAFVAIFEIIGETGLHLIVSFSLCVVLFYFISKPIFQKKWLNYLLYVLIVCANVLVCWFAIDKIFEGTSNYFVQLNDYLTSFVGKITIILLGVMLNLLVIFLSGKIKKDVLPNLFRWAIVVLISSALSILCVRVLKVLFGRTRFRAMTYVGDGDFNYYTNWFSINTNKFESISAYATDFFKSFPSGHASAAASGILLVFLPKFVPQSDDKKWKISFGLLTIVFTVLVCYSRILAGAHFLSDVLVGVAITVGLSILTLFGYQKVEAKIQGRGVSSLKNSGSENFKTEDGAGTTSREKEPTTHKPAEKESKEKESPEVSKEVNFHQGDKKENGEVKSKTSSAHENSNTKSSNYEEILSNLKQEKLKKEKSRKNKNSSKEEK